LIPGMSQIFFISPKHLYQGSLPGGNKAWVWSWPFIFSKCQGNEYMGLYIHSPHVSPWHAEGWLYLSLYCQYYVML
jgi:hypothetical protein